MMASFSHEFIVAEHDARHSRVIHAAPDGRILRQFSVENPLDLDLLPNGHVLLSCNRAVIELDVSFREVWRHEVEKVALYSCQQTTDGNVLFGDTSAARICEVNRGGEIVRSMPFPYAGDYQPYNHMFRLIRALPDDRLLVACFHDCEVTEFSWAGEILWTASLEGHPYMPIRLENGHTLISLGPEGLIVEIDHAGVVVWRYDMEEDSGLERGWIAGISRLANGNLVYSDSRHDRLVEVTPDKKLISIFQNREVLLHPSTHIIL